MISKTYELGTLKHYKYVVVLSEYNEKILLSRHKERKTWETQGGHIENGETPLEAAKRELFEESGAVDFEIIPFCDYWAGNPDTGEGANGMVFTAAINRLDKLPESEMAEVKTFDQLPKELTYPAITTVLFAKKQIGKSVTVTVDRKMGTFHPKHYDIFYSVNYGYVDGVVGGDGDMQDAYIIGVSVPVDSFDGVIKAVVHRFDDDEDKWVVCPKNYELTENEVLEKLHFQEKYFKSCIIM